MNYTTKQSLFDENRTDIRGAAAFYIIYDPLR